MSDASEPGPSNPVASRPEQTARSRKSPSVLRRRLRWFVAAGIFMVCGALFGTVFLPRNPPVAFALLHVSREQPRFLSAPRFHAAQSESFETYRQTQVELVKSRAVLTVALRDPEVAELIAARTPSEPMDWLEGHLRVEVQPDPEVLRISFNDGSPEDQVKVVRAITKAFLQEAHDMEKREWVRQLDRLGELLNFQRSNIYDQRQSLWVKEESPQVDGLHLSSRLRSELVAEDLKAYHQELRRVRLAMIGLRAKVPNKDDPALKEDMPAYNVLANEEALLLKAILTAGETERELRRKEGDLNSIRQQLQGQENSANRIMVEMDNTVAEARNASPRVSLIREPEIGKPPKPWYERLRSLLK